MKSIVVAFLLVLCLSSTVTLAAKADGKNQDKSKNKTEPAVDVIPEESEVVPEEILTLNYYMAIGRGFISGYYLGMYKETKYKVQKLCLSNETVNDMYYVYLTIY